MRSQLSDSCPNCRAQIVLYEDGFECSICGYTLAMWTAFLCHEEFPFHKDSPALYVSDLTTAQMREALEEASARG